MNALLLSAVAVLCVVAAFAAGRYSARRAGLPPEVTGQSSASRDAEDRSIEWHLRALRAVHGLRYMLHSGDFNAYGNEAEYRRSWRRVEHVVAEAPVFLAAEHRDDMVRTHQSFRSAISAISDNFTYTMDIDKLLTASSWAQDRLQDFERLITQSLDTLHPNIRRQPTIEDSRADEF